MKRFNPNINNGVPNNIITDAKINFVIVLFLALLNKILKALSLSNVVVLFTTINNSLLINYTCFIILFI